MNTTETKPVTYDIKKEKRFQAKKRKLEALVNLFQEDEKTMADEKKKKANTTVQDEYKALKEELKKYTKKPDLDPCFYLTDIGNKSERRLKSQKVSKNVRPLFVVDMYHVLLKSVIGHMSPYAFNWAKLEQPQNISKTVFLVIEGIPKSVIIQNRSSLTNVTDIFPFVVDIASSNLPFPQELVSLGKVTHFHIENKSSYSSMFPNKRVVEVKSDENLQKPSKLHLLLSPIQLVMENFPLPKGVFPYSKSDGYTYSKDRYDAVTSTSPMFALDCEMCRTEKSNSELTRIAVVNENLDIVYQSLVKPKSKIIDYLTKFSGITKGMLHGVKTRLEDVQKELRTILPADAILCGQSLNCDLHALKMIHPYVIDTSIIFNGSGMRGKKDSLKYLSMIHLKEDIQSNKNGHNPIEDALATMKLVQLKLNNSIGFGDACIVEKAELSNEEVPASDCNNVTQKENNDDLKEADKLDNEVNGTDKLDTDEVKESLFKLTSKYNKKVCLIGREETLDFYGGELPDSVQKIAKSSESKVVKSTLNNMENFDLTISHIDYNSSDKSDLLGELNDVIKLVYDNCASRTMFMVYLSGADVSNFQDISTGMFMTVVKKDK